MANNICRCPFTDKRCFAKAGHRGMCFLLSEPALYTVGEDENGNEVKDCKFRKLHQSMPPDWEPKSDYDKIWAEKDLKRKALA